MVRHLARTKRVCRMRYTRMVGSIRSSGLILLENRYDHSMTPRCDRAFVVREYYVIDAKNLLVFLFQVWRIKLLL